MKKIKINNQEVMAADKVIIVGLKNEKEVSMSVAGELQIEEAMDMLNTVYLETLNAFLKSLPEEKQDKLKKVIYERATWGVSMMLDQFYPEGKKNKFKGLTDEAIIKAQNEVLKERIANRKQ